MLHKECLSMQLVMRFPRSLGFLSRTHARLYIYCHEADADGAASTKTKLRWGCVPIPVARIIRQRPQFSQCFAQFWHGELRHFLGLLRLEGLPRRCGDMLGLWG